MGCAGKCRSAPISSFFQELDAQHEALDLVVAAINLVFIVGQADGRNLGPALQRNPGTPYLSVFDKRD